MLPSGGCGECERSPLLPESDNACRPTVCEMRKPFGLFAEGLVMSGRGTAIELLRPFDVAVERPLALLSRAYSADAPRETNSA